MSEKISPLATEVQTDWRFRELVGKMMLLGIPVTVILLAITIYVTSLSQDGNSFQPVSDRILPPTIEIVVDEEPTGFYPALEDTSTGIRIRAFDLEVFPTTHELFIDKTAGGDLLIQGQERSWVGGLTAALTEGQLIAYPGERYFEDSRGLLPGFAWVTTVERDGNSQTGIRRLEDDRLLFSVPFEHGRYIGQTSPTQFIFVEYQDGKSQWKVVDVSNDTVRTLTTEYPDVSEYFIDQQRNLFAVKDYDRMTIFSLGESRPPVNLNQVKEFKFSQIGAVIHFEPYPHAYEYPMEYLWEGKLV